MNFLSLSPCTRTLTVGAGSLSSFHSSKYHLLKVNSSSTLVLLSFISPQATVIFRSNYFLPFAFPFFFFLLPQLTVIDSRLKMDNFSSVGVCWTRSHDLVVLRPRGPWKRLYSPLLFPFHCDTLCLHFPPSSASFS